MQWIKLNLNLEFEFIYKFYNVIKQLVMFFPGSNCAVLKLCIPS